MKAPFLVGSSVFRTLIVLCLFAGVCALSGCLPAARQDVRQRTAPLAVATPLDEARLALGKGNYKQAEAFAQKVIQAGQEPPHGMRQAYRIYAIAAANNTHPNAAISALDRWRALEPTVENSREWQDIWALSMRQLSPQEVRVKAGEAWADTARGLGARNLALVFLTMNQWQKGSLETTLPELEKQYEATTGKELKKLFEERLLLELEHQNAATAATAHAAVTPENQGVFPYAIVAIDNLRRELKNPATQGAAQAALEALAKELTLADPSLVRGPHSRQVEPLIPPTITGRPIVLTLPLTGQFSGISAKIVAGAEVACREFSAAGTAVSLVVIDTDQSNWIAQVDALPPEASIIGGPMRTTDYSQLKSQGALSRRAFLTFLPSLEGQDEGQMAWRFFSSAPDQVQALLEMTTRLGITGYGIFYPEENYGTHMAGLFENTARTMGAKTVNKAAYTPNSPSSWLRSVGTLLATNKNPEIASSSTFMAIFLPDSWKNMDIIVPNIFYYGETRQILLGPALWEQELTGKTLVNPEYYKLAVFPGAWNPMSTSPAKAMLESSLTSVGKGPADFWHGLGYDFARFASATVLSSPSSPRAVNMALQSTTITWSMAPLQWSNDGKASQALFLFTPQENGFAPLDEAEFAKLVKSTWK